MLNYRMDSLNTWHNTLYKQKIPPPVFCVLYGENKITASFAIERVKSSKLK